MKAELETAAAESWVVKIERGGFESEGEIGYVVTVGPELLLLLIISTEIRFNGFALLRIDDITKLDAPHEHCEFVEAALRLRQETVEEAPVVSVEDMGTALRAISTLSPTVAIHREAIDSSVCHIGKIVRADQEQVHLLEIDPDAEWEEEPTLYAIGEITRVDFGGGYEEALALVGGPGPEISHLRPVK